MNILLSCRVRFTVGTARPDSRVTRKLAAKALARALALLYLTGCVGTASQIHVTSTQSVLWKEMGASAVWWDIKHSDRCFIYYHAFDPFNMLQYLVAFSAKLPGQETAMSVEKTQTLTPIQIANFNAEMEPARRWYSYSYSCYFC